MIPPVAGYHPDNDYALRRLNDEDGLDPQATYYLRGKICTEPSSGYQVVCCRPSMERPSRVSS